MKTNPDHSAFTWVDHSTMAKGLTKREYFAAMAMQGLIIRLDLKEGSLEHMREVIALEAIAQTDVLITELNKAP